MSMTMEEIDNLAKEVKELYNQKKDLEEKQKDVAKEYNTKAFRLIGILKDHDRTKHEGGFGKISVVTRNYFKITDYEKAMEWLKEDGTYESLRKVSAADFSKRVCEVAVEEGPNKTKIVNPDSIPLGAEYSPTEFLRIT